MLRTLVPPGLALAALGGAVSAHAAAPLDLWPPEVMQKVRDRTTLNPRLVAHLGYFEVYYDSEVGEAKWADAGPPWEVHTGGTIRIHGWLATPLVGGPYPGVVIGHGHRGRGSRELAIALAAMGYAALSIDGPGQGRSTGPPDSEQAWISVEEVANEPSPEVSYLYHYAYAGMRGLTLLDRLSRMPFNPLRIDRGRLGVVGASMGGQLAYYVNGVDDRVKAAVAVAAAGDWEKLLHYPGSWLYHGLYHYTRDGLRSGLDDLNTISDVCRDPTLRTFTSHFDPIQYAPRQHAPLLVIMGTHDQYFTLPAANTTFDRVASAGTNPRFLKRLLLAPDGKHEVVNEDAVLRTVWPVLADVHGWLDYCFRRGGTPPSTPVVRRTVDGESLRFRVAAPRGSSAIRTVRLHYATQIDTFPDAPCDFASLRLVRAPDGAYEGSLPIGTSPPCGPPVTPENLLYFASVQDQSAYRVSSRLYYGDGEMDFGTGFVPAIEHFPRDDFEVPPPPPACER
jgi:cephalosporin-C deacetylase-like acetyl esterase